MRHCGRITHMFRAIRAVRLPAPHQCQPYIRHVHYNYITTLLRPRRLPTVPTSNVGVLSRVSAVVQNTVSTEAQASASARTPVQRLRAKGNDGDACVRRPLNWLFEVNRGGVTAGYGACR